MDLYEKAREEAADALAEACKKLRIKVGKKEILPTFEHPKEEFCDLASTICFELAKKLKRNPRALAGEIIPALKLKGKLLEKAEAAGAGYINFHFNLREFASELFSEIQKNEKFGSCGIGNGKKALVEFIGVNPNKPWHVGHMRNAIIGDCISNVLEFAGYKVERENYIDDLGLQVAQSVWGYLNLSSRAEGKIDHWLGKQYVEVAKRAEQGKAAEEIKGIVKELEEGSSKTASLAKELCEKCVLAQYETSFRLGIFQDVLIWESDIVRAKLLALALEKATKSGAAVKEKEGKNAGCLVAKLENLPEFSSLESPDKILVRSDGTATYTGKDLAFQLWKFGLIPSALRYKAFARQPNGKELYTTASEGKEAPFGKADIVINVIGVEQAYPQQALIALLKLMGHEKEADNSVHLSYEHAWLPDAKFSGRKGTWLGYSADEVLDEAAKRAYAEVRERFKDMGEGEKKEISEAVGIGAVRFSFIRTTPEKKIIFSWEKSLSFEGDSAPYIMYSHARACRILEKAGGFKGEPNFSALSLPEEKSLVKILAKFPSAVAASAKDFRPHYIADYLLSLAASFSSFYAVAPVLAADEKTKSARLALVLATKRVLKNGLALLGIAAPERM